MKRLFKDNNLYEVTSQVGGEVLNPPLQYVGLDNAFDGVERMRRAIEQEFGVSFTKMIEDDPTRADYVEDLS